MAVFRVMAGLREQVAAGERKRRLRALRRKK
jgi:hypothetical protein